MGASGGMTSQRWTPAVCFLLASVFGKVESMTTSEIYKYTCRTFGSGVLEPFSGLGFYVLSNCPFTFTRFTHNRVECDITIRRGNNGLLVQVEIIINKVSTVLQNGSIQVEEKSVSLPYDHTYQHIFQYGIYTRLRSSLLPMSITWHSVPGGIDSLWVELEEELSPDMTGLCGKHNVTSNEQQLIRESVITDDTCQTRDPTSVTNPTPHYNCNLPFSATCSDGSCGDICRNIYSYEKSEYIGCAFYKEIALHCGKSTYIWDNWRSVTQCAYPTCPGDLMYEEEGAAFVPSCSNPHPQFSSLDITSSCICPQGEVLNDQSDGFRCIHLSSCPCVFARRTYLTGDIRNTKCQSCLCEGGKWHCSENFCPTKCRIEGQFVTTFDGKQYIVPGKCTYLAFQGLNWTVIIQFSESDASLKKVVLQHFQEERYTFTNNMVTFGDQDITDLHQSDHAQVFWQSSMYVYVETSSDYMIQIQMSPEIQLYMSVLTKHESVITGLCGNSNSDSTDDFTSSSRIVENSAQPFALSWSVGACAVNIPTTCINTHNEIFADERCSVLNNPTGIFSECHKHLPPDQYHAACIQRTCNCGSSVERCLCVALGRYAKACASLGIFVGDWRKATNCTLSCPKNQEFFYNIRACNRTCRSLSGTDPFCSLNDAPVEGCGCPEGTYLNQESTCTEKADCVCHHHGGITLPGPVVIEGRQCLCENGKLTCSKDCSCNNGKVCVQCSENAIKTAQKTCESLSKPLDSNMTCESGCYCPNDQYEDHYGNCVSRDNCTCVYSGEVFSAGQHVRTSCKKCICGQGQWDCRDEPCQGMCQVYGNGHYETFDSKWYRFSGHCQYTLVEDYCGGTNGTFSVRVESVPCCDEALTCSRSILLDLQGKVTLILSDTKVAKRLQQDLTLQENSLYSVDSVGLYIIVSVPSSGITLIWDKHTRLVIKLHENWRNKVCGLCGNFDSNEMNDLQISGSAVMSGPMAFGNSWKAAAPPCSDVTYDIFPCDRNSYCSAWAQRRCMIIKGDAFRDCHLKVDPDPYYQACLLESCSCEFEGKFLGFCTAVAAYAEACSDQDVCINWRTPDLCPIYCDYYNKPDQSIWHYEACGKMQICGKEHHFTENLEGCYPRCPMETPYYDVNAEECTTLRKCSCYFNDTIVQPGEVVMIKSFECPCENGTITCRYPTPEARSMTEIWTMIPTTNTSSITSANTSATTETGLTVSTVFSMSATAILTTTEKWSGKTSATSSSTTVAPSTKTGTWSRIPTINSSMPNPTFTSAVTENAMIPTSSSVATLSSFETGSPIPTTTSMITAKVASAATETLSTKPTTTSTPATSSTSTTIFTPTTPTQTWSTMSTAIPTSNTTATSASAGTPLTTLSTTSTLSTVETSLFTETWSTMPNTVSTPTSTAPSGTNGVLSSMPTTNFISTTPASSSTHETLATLPTTPISSVIMATSAITEQSPTSTTISLLSTWSKNPNTLSIPTTSTRTTTEKWSTVPTSVPTATTTPMIETMPTTAFTPTTKTSPNSTETRSMIPTSTQTTKLILATTEKWSSLQTNSYMSTTADISNSTEKRSIFPVATATQTSSDSSTSTETLSTMPPTISRPMVSNTANSAETWSVTPRTISTLTSTSTTTETWSKMPLFTSTIRVSSITPEEWTTIRTTTVTQTTKATLTTSESLSTKTTASPATTGISATTQTKAVFPISDSTLITPTTSSTTATKTWSIMPTTTFIPTTGSLSATSETQSVPTTATTTSIPTWPTTSTTTTTETSSPMPTITSIPPVTGASTTTEMMSTTSKPTTSATSLAAETWATMPTTTYSQPNRAILSNSTEAWSEMSTTTSVLMTTNTDVSMITESTSNTPVSSLTPEKSRTIATTSLLTTNRMRATSSVATAAPPQRTSVIHTTLLSLSTGSPETQSSTFKVVSTPLPPCECKDLNKKKNWACGEMWTDDCFQKYCVNGKIVLTPLECPEPEIPDCPRGRVTNVSDGCCETWKCDCHCNLYGETHYISFQGVTFDFLDQCTYILVEERSPHHNLTIGVDSSSCVPGFQGSCSQEIILRYQNNVATLSIVPQLFKVQATLNNVIIQPPYEEHGLKFETVEHKVTIQLPDIRSFVSLTPYYTLLVSLAMENFYNNTQGQCGVCGGASCIRKGGKIEDESCCDKTAYDWIYEDPQKPACFSAPKEVPCHSEPTSLLAKIPTTCLPSLMCELLDSVVFENCSNFVNLNLQKKNCKFDSCYNPNASCSALEQAAEECKNAGFCVDWRRLTNGTCDVACPDGLVYRECYDKQDDFCYAGLRNSGVSLKKSTAGCFCPSNLLRAGKHSNICVVDCSFCKGPTGEPKLPGEVWQSSCYVCTCNNQTYTEECFPKPPEPAPVCGPTTVLVNSSCCGDQICVEKTCRYNQQIYKAGDKWMDPAHSCVSFSCSKEGIQTDTKVCPEENCPEEDRIWDDQHCCYTCKKGCAPMVSSINITIENCSTIIQMPVCHGQCAPQQRVVLKVDLVLEQENKCCTEQSSERRSVTLLCSDLTTREYTYKHITSCVCKPCTI